MINNILNNESNAMSKLLAESKDKVITAAKKRAEEEARAQLPTPEDLQVQLQSTIASNESEIQEALLEVEVVYNRFISIIDKAIKKLDDGKEELTSIREKLNKIQSKLDLLEGFIDPINLIFATIGTALIAIDVGLAASSSTFANGSTINKLGEIKTKLKDLVAKGKGALDSISGIKEYFEEQINKILDPLNKGITKFEESIQILTLLRDTMILIYTQFIESLILQQLNDEDNDNPLLGNETLLGYLENDDNLSTILSDALQSTSNFEGLLTGSESQLSAFE
jgi:hypothetical protein